MALIFNGTTVPTNVANALIYNGTNITKVIFNNTEVWAQSLFNAKWSGSSKSSGDWNFTMSTSGNLLRYVSLSYTGPWITANLNGTFTGNSLVGNNGLYGFITSGNLLRFRFYDPSKKYADTANWCTFTIDNKQWTGKSWQFYKYYTPPEGYITITNTMETGGGLIRANQNGRNGGPGPWISLT